MRRRGFTVMELLVAAGILTIVLGVLYAFLSRIFSNDRPSATRMTTASFVRQDVRLAFQKLMDRLEEGIEVLAPPPGGTAADLEFKDVLNHDTTIGLNPGGQLVSFSGRGASRTEEAGPTTVATPGGGTFAVARPIKIPSVRKVYFTVLSPTLVSMVLTVADGNQTGTLVATARLRNYRQAEP